MKLRNPLILTFFLFATVTLMACKDSGSPEAITKLFLISLNKGDFETASNIATKNTNDILKIMQHLTENVLTDDVKETRSDDFEVKILGKIKDSDSTFIVKYETKPSVLPFNQVKLLRFEEKDGRERWKVDISTLDLAGGDEQYGASESPNNDGQIFNTSDTIGVKEE